MPPSLGFEGFEHETAIIANRNSPEAPIFDFLVRFTAKATAAWIALTVVTLVLMWWGIRLSADDMLRLYFPGVTKQDVVVKYAKGDHFVGTFAVLVFTPTKPFPLARLFPKPCGFTGERYAYVFTKVPGFSPTMRCSEQVGPRGEAEKRLIFYENAETGPFYFYGAS